MIHEADPTELTPEELATINAAVRLKSPMDIGWQFVQEYYTILKNEPQCLHRFYHKKSMMLHGVEGESVTQCYGQSVLPVFHPLSNPLPLL